MHTARFSTDRARRLNYVMARSPSGIGYEYPAHSLESRCHRPIRAQRAFLFSYSRLPRCTCSPTRTAASHHVCRFPARRIPPGAHGVDVDVLSRYGRGCLSVRARTRSLTVAHCLPELRDAVSALRAAHHLPAPHWGPLMGRGGRISISLELLLTYGQGGGMPFALQARAVAYPPTLLSKRLGVFWRTTLDACPRAWSGQYSY